MIRHVLYVYSSRGILLAVLPDGALVEMNYAFRENEPGVLEFTVPGSFNRDLLMIDGIVEVYRDPGTGIMQLEGETAFFIRRIRSQTSDAGIPTHSVKAFSALVLAQRRIIPYFAGTSFTEKIGMWWDDMLREVVDENLGDEATDSARNLAPWLTVEPDYSWGASFNKSMAWGKVLDILQEIADDVRSSGVYAAFDIVRTAPATFIFKVFVGARGLDHSKGTAFPVIVSEDRRNLLSPLLDDEWTDEVNFIYATGQGQGTSRTVKTAEDIERIGISPFNRIEYQREARQASADETVQAEADTALENGRPRRLFSGKINQTQGCQYGIHWRWGDIVTAEYLGISIDCHVDAVVVKLEDSGEEVVEGQLRSVTDVG